MNYAGRELGFETKHSIALNRPIKRTGGQINNKIVINVLVVLFLVLCF